MPSFTLAHKILYNLYNIWSWQFLKCTIRKKKKKKSIVYTGGIKLTYTGMLSKNIPGVLYLSQVCLYTIHTCGSPHGKLKTGARMWSFISTSSGTLFQSTLKMSKKRKRSFSCFSFSRWSAHLQITRERERDMTLKQRHDVSTTIITPFLWQFV